MRSSVSQVPSVQSLLHNLGLGSSITPTRSGVRRAIDSLHARFESAQHELQQILAEMKGMQLRIGQLEEALAAMSDSEPEESLLDDDVMELSKAFKGKGRA